VLDRVGADPGWVCATAAGDAFAAGRRGEPRGGTQGWVRRQTGFWEEQPQPQFVEGRVVYPLAVSPGPVRISTKDSADGEGDGVAACAGNGEPRTIDPVASRAAAALAIR
jgi:hypothetical protein